MFNKSNIDTKIEKFVEEKQNLPKILISPLAMAKMDKIIQYCDDEVGWLGSAEKIEDYTYFISDVHMFEQEVNATTCEIAPDGLNKFAMEILESENGMEEYSKIRVWGHSHVNMGVTPSGQDDKQIADFAGDNDWFIRIIANKKGDIKLDIFDYKNNVVYLSVDWDVFYEDYTEELKELEKKIDEKVKKKTYTYAKKANKVGKSANIYTQSYIDDYYESDVKNYYESDEDIAYWDGYQDAIVGMYDSAIYDEERLIENYIDGHEAYMRVIYKEEGGSLLQQNDLSVNEIYSMLTNDDIKDLRDLPFQDFREIVLDYYGVEGWAYNDFIDLRAEINRIK